MSNCRSTAVSALREVQIEGLNQEQQEATKEGIVNLCVDMQIRLRDMSQRLQQEYRR